MLRFGTFSVGRARRADSNHDGCAVVHIHDDGEHVYLHAGELVASAHNDSVYAYSAKYLGWIQWAWVWDRNGCPAFFTESAQGGLTKPVKQLKPIRGVRSVRPVKGGREVPTARPVRTLTWSEKSDESFLKD